VFSLPEAGTAFLGLCKQTKRKREIDFSMPYIQVLGIELRFPGFQSKHLS
ncbi:hypothetical protein LEMLEM_LOCUS8659, partial [Lemmus lemmus]